MDTYQDFGFNSNEFLGKLTTVPYCQFLNASTKNYGIAITPANAELARFEITDSWQLIEHEFSDGSNASLLVAKQPRLLVLNRSLPLMTNGLEMVAYTKEKFQTGEYKAFSYVVVWFLDDNNKPLSDLPFRLKCSGFAGLTFLKNYSYYNNPNSFCKQFLQTYKILTGDRAIDKNEIFYAHGVYQPTLTRQKATSSINGQSSFAVMTNSFLKPNTSNFGSLIIKNGTEVSHKIKELIETTKPWLEIDAISSSRESESASINSKQVENLSSEAKSCEPIVEQNGIEAGLTPEPIPF